MKLEDEIKSKFRNEYHKAIVNLHFTQLACANAHAFRLKKYGISSQQFNVLRILRGQHPNSASIGLIKDRMLDKNSDVSRIIDRLKQKKLVSRKECKMDRRQKDVLISSNGMNLLAELDKYDHEIDLILSGLSEEETVQLNELLDKLRAGIKKQR